MNTNLSSKDILELAISKHKKQDLSGAEKLYQEVLNKDDKNFNANFLLGTVFASTKRFELALIKLEKAKIINPNYADTYNNLANVYKEQNKIELAKKNYNLAIKINPKHINAIDNLGIIFLQENELSLAEANFKKAISINPNFINAHYNLGLAYVKLGKLLKAKESYLKVIQINPNFVIALNALANISKILEKTNDAIYYYKKVAQLQPNFKDVHIHLGNLYRATGDFEQALNSYELGLKFKPDELLIYNEISFLNEKIIDTELYSKVKKIINNDKCSKENLVYGNFILSKYENKNKNYETELECLYKAHKYFFELPKNESKFQKSNNFWLKKVPEFNELFEFNLKKKMDDNEYKKLNPIFIVGLPRSGSTLIEKLISSCDKKIKIGEETSIITNFVSNQINNNKKLFDNIDIKRKKIISHYSDKDLIGNEKINIFTDKTLSNYFFIKFIIEIFPGAKFINCIRNPVASIISILKTNLSEISWAHNLSDIFKFFDIYFTIIDKMKVNFSDYIYDIEYEKLIINQQTELKKLFKFCKLPWDQKCLEFYKNDFVSLTASNIQVRKPIFKDSLNTYLNYKEFLDKYGTRYSWWSR